MEIRFEDHAGFQRSAAVAAAGAGLAAAVAPQAALLPVAIAGTAVALAVADGLGRRLARALGIAGVAAAAAYLGPAKGWLVPAAGALLGLLFAMAGEADADRPRPPRWAVAATIALSAGAVLLAEALLLPLAAALAAAVPGWMATGASGAAFGLWAAFAAAPLHVSAGVDPIEAKLAALRVSLAPDLRALAERAAAARRGATDDLPPGTRADLRTLLDQLALAALELAARCDALGRSAPQALQDELQRRSEQLARNADGASDAAAQKSYLRAAEALEGQLDHFRRVRRARERALARLHEDVANLERARFSLTLFKGRGPMRGAAGLDLLHAQLQQGALVFEAEEEITSAPWPTSGTPVDTSASAASASSRSSISSR
ncbi:MAG TPA: hypothetical protein VLW85_02915 [Myxococcales bacterium]|nr:hypothetical protein [Myxococcales bacterium]